MEETISPEQGVEVWDSPIALPESKSRKMRIEHELIREADIVSMRESLLTGKRAVRVKFEEPRLVHKLVEDGRGVWMTDLPIELEQMARTIRETDPWGDCLVGGLGLGVMPTWLAECPDVHSVTVVEKSRDVAKLCGKSAAFEVVVQDLFKFLREADEWKWDWAFFDIWQGTNEGTYWEYVFPLRRIVARKFGRDALKELHCWAEDQMLGQVLNKLTFADGRQWNEIAEQTKDQSVRMTWKPHWHYKNEQPMSIGEARYFTGEIGTEGWEKDYGHLYPGKQYGAE